MIGRAGSSIIYPLKFHLGRQREPQLLAHAPARKRAPGEAGLLVVQPRYSLASLLSAGFIEKALNRLKQFRTISLHH